MHADDDDVADADADVNDNDLCRRFRHVQETVLHLTCSVCKCLLPYSL